MVIHCSERSFAVQDLAGRAQGWLRRGSPAQARKSGRSVPPSAWLGLIGAPRDGHLWSWFSVCRPPVNVTLAPPNETKVPGVSLRGGPLCRQMKIIAIGGMMETVAAILIAAGVGTLVLLGILFVMGVGWFIMARL